MKETFPAGKLPQEVLERILHRLPGNDPRVLVGPRVGEDAAVIDMGDRYLVAKTDPITFATDRIGWYLVHINANDIACMGARPRWLLVTCLLPERGTDEKRLDEIFQDLSSACEALGITICGGHTEVTLGLDRPILVGQLLGEVSKEGFVDKRRITTGDRILLTKGIAIEGTCVIARERGDALEDRVSSDLVEKARNLLVDPGISVVRDARLAVQAGGRHIHGMHDPTEGGLFQGVRELAEGLGFGVRIEGSRVPVLPETRSLCGVFGIRPEGLLASGALVILVSPEAELCVKETLEQDGIACTRIGDVCHPGKGLTWVRDGRELELPSAECDELIRALQKSF